MLNLPDKLSDYDFCLGNQRSDGRSPKLPEQALQDRVGKRKSFSQRELDN